MSPLYSVFLYCLIGMCFLCLYRVIKGPTIADRMVGIDIMGILVVGITAIIALKTDRMYILDIGIAWIILSFIGTLTLAKYLGRNKLNE
jgi:multicomponent Na+:H+ antiporter subunit F